MSARRRRQHLKAINPAAWDPQDHNARQAVEKAVRRFWPRPFAAQFLAAKYGVEWLQRYWR